MGGSVFMKLHIKESYTDILVDKLNNIIKSSDYNINIAAFDIKDELETVPIGTEIKINAYRHSTAGQLQSVFKRVSDNTWTYTWRVADGEIYWVTNRTTDTVASEIFNALCPED